MPDFAAGTPPWGQYLRDLESRVHQPREHLLLLLKEQVAHALAAVGASGGSILVSHGDGRHLRFLVSSGPGAEQIDNTLVPLEGSIAGCVFTTGQMVAVGDLSKEQPPNFYAEVGRRIGIATRTYLALPILVGGRHGVATYVNRPGPPPYQPFQADEINRAVAFTRIEGVVLRHLERTEQLIRLARADLAPAWEMLDNGGGGTASSVGVQGEPADPLVRILSTLERLSEDDRDFCADLVSFVAHRRGREKQDEL